jgi:hypothetical protein
VTGPLSEFGLSWAEMVEIAADWQTDLLRRRAVEMADALDREAMRAVEGAREWRSPTTQRRYPS